MKILTLVLCFLVCLTFPLIGVIAAEPLKNNITNNTSVFDIIKRIKQKQQAYDKSVKSRIVDSSAWASTDITTELGFIDEDNSAQTNGNVNNAPSLLENNASGIAEGEELILSLYLGKLYLADIFAYKSESGSKINLRDLFEAIEFSVDFDTEKQVAIGWFIKEENSFALDYSQLKNENSVAHVRVNGEDSTVLAKDIIMEGDDIYIEGDIVASWFNLEIAYNYNEQKIIVQASQPLPIQARLARENRKIYSQTENKSVMPWKKSDYQLFSSPLLDFQLLSTIDNNKNKRTSYSALGQHDLGYLNSQYYFSGDKDGLDSARFKLSKDLAKNTKFNFISDAHIEIGDIVPIQTRVRYNTNTARGFSLSTAKDNDIHNNTININGDIQPGWDIELYRNTILIDKQISLQSGRYEFNNITLLYGNNLFEMVLYGPHGEILKRTKEVYFDKSMLANNSSNYAFSVAQVGKSVLGVDNNQALNTEGLLLSGRFSRGISESLSFELGHSSLFQDDNDKEDIHSSSLGLNLNLFERLLLSSTVTVDNHENKVVDFSAKAPWTEHTLLYQYNWKEYSNKVNELANGKSNDYYHLITMNGSLFDNKSVRINYQNEFQNRNIESVETTLLSNALSLSFKRFSIQNSLAWQEVSAGIDSFTSTTGNINIQRNLGPIFTRLSSNYLIKPTTEFLDVNVDLSWNLSERVQSNLQLTYLPDSDLYRSRFSINWHNDHLNVSTNVSYSSDDRWSLGLMFRFALGYQLDYNKFFVSSNPLSNSGSTMVRVFQDDNANNIYDEGEVLLDGVKVKALQSHRQGISGEDGIAVIKNMPNNVVTDISIDATTFDDPFLISGNSGVAITPRRGLLTSIDYPVVTASEIDGTIYLTNKSGIETPLSFAKLNLIDENNEIVGTTRSEYDGYYLFVDLIPGKYTVSISEEYIKKQKLKGIDGLSIILTAQGDVINGSDFILSQLEFTSGYIANIGKFSSLNMLKTYWYLINRRHRARLQQAVFYIKDDLTNKYYLNLAFYELSTEADSACDAAQKLKISCTVEPYELVQK